MTAASLCAALVLALLHIANGRVLSFNGGPHRRWLSFGGGIAVAYVFVHLMPELADLQQSVQETHPDTTWYWRHHLYLVGLAGLTIFYLTEHLAKKALAHETQQENRYLWAVFAAHMALLVLYNAFIGYFLTTKASSDVPSLLIFTIVFALHLLGNDQFLREDYKELYRRFGRWALAAAVPAGCILGLSWEIPELPYGTVLGFLAGGVTLNAIKEELPRQKESRFGAFIAGAAICAAALVSVQ